MDKEEFQQRVCKLPKGGNIGRAELKVLLELYTGKLINYNGLTDLMKKDYPYRILNHKGYIYYKQIHMGEDLTRYRIGEDTYLLPYGIQFMQELEIRVKGSKRENIELNIKKYPSIIALTSVIIAVISAIVSFFALFYSQ